MALPTIKLDERTFQDLVDEAKLRIPRYCPQWTNHNVSDPGVALIELFAYMVDHLLYQINRVPEKNYRAFLEMIGVRLAPPNAAQVEITFRLSAAQPQGVNIPKYTEVATVRTEGQPARTFTTGQDLVIVPPNLKYVVSAAHLDSPYYTDHTKAVFDPRSRQPVKIFADSPQPGNVFYLGFAANIASNTLVIGLNCQKLGVGIAPDDPPLIWEYWDELQGEWQAAQVRRDTTGGLTFSYGEVEMQLPASAGRREISLSGAEGDERMLAWWVRCRYRELNSNQEPYNISPEIETFSSYSIGGTVAATHSQIIRQEELGVSTGEPGQRFRLENTPVLTLQPEWGETIVVDPQVEGQALQVWTLVQDFAASGPTDKHFGCDYITGEISFGPTLRNPHNQEEQHGAIPPYNSRIILGAYRSGGGTEGNVGSRTITVLKTSIPYVDSVINERPATGGTNPETLERALVRGPSTLRARNRAVTVEDFEVLAREATSGVARVRCLVPAALDHTNGREAGADEGGQVEPGTVVLMVVPEVEAAVRELRPEHLSLPAGMRATIANYLDDRRLLTTRLDLTTPRYQWVTVQARIKTLNPFVNERVKAEAERRLYQFIRPVGGGPDLTLGFHMPGEGWPFGRTLYMSEIYPLLHTIEGVEYVEKVELFPVQDLKRGHAGSPVTQINPGPRGLLCSYRHQILLDLG